MMEQSIGQWGKFSSALESLINERKRTSANRLQRLADLDLAILIMRKSEKFYFPAQVDIVDGKKMTPEFQSLLRLPYPYLAVATETPTKYVMSDTVDQNASNPLIILAAELTDEFILKSRWNTEPPIEGSDYGFVCFALSYLVPYKKWSLYPMWVEMNFYPGQYRMSTGGEQDWIDEISKSYISTEDMSKKIASATTGAVNNLSVLMNVKNTQKVRIDPPPALNKKRLRNGNLPLYSYHVLEIDGEKWDTPHPKGDGTGPGTRSYLRCGHIRQFRPGEYCWVRFHMVHGAIPGFVDKEYKIKPPKGDNDGQDRTDA